MAKLSDWVYDQDAIYDETGDEAAIRPDGIEDQTWEYQAERICAAMNKEAKA